MIKNYKPLSMAEVTEYVDKKSEIAGFIKKFTKTKPESAKELRKKLEALDLMKIREEHIVKIIDLMPENLEDLNKIFVGVSLDEDETKKVLDTIKDFK
ncbi:MAG: hypothetical protein ABIB79_01890 [archaeon]